MNIPIITLQIEGMKHTIRTALMEQALKLDAGVQAALEKLCTEENISQIVHEEARRQLEAALKEEVRNFFSFNEGGRIAVREAVHEYLERQYPIKSEADI